MTDYTPILKLPEVAPNQNQKEDTINTALAILESAMNNVKVYTLTGAGPRNLTEDDYTRYFLHRFSGQTAAYEVTVPAALPRWFAVENAGSFAITVRCQGVTGGLPFEVPPGKIGLAVSDGSDVRTVVPQSGMGLLQDLSDVSGVPTDKQVLRYDAATSLWKPSTFTMAFTQLTDVPGSYSAQQGKLVAVNAAGTGLEFVTSASNVNDFLDLTDTPSSYAGAAGKTVKVSSGGTGLVFGSPTFLESTDTPSSYSGGANKFVRVNPGSSALIFSDVKLTDLSDGPGTYTGFGGMFLRVKNDGTGFEFNTGSGGPDNFLDLTDTPDAYTGQGNKAVRVKSDVSGLEFYTPNFLLLSDTPADYSGAANKVLRVNGAGNAVVFSTLAFQDLQNVPAAQANKWLRWNPTATALINDTPTFLGLSDTPAAYAGNEGKYVYVKGDGSGLGFTATSANLSFLELNDTIDTTYDSKTDMVPIVTIVSGSPVLQLGYYAFAKLAGVSLSSPTNGQILGYNATSGLWTNIDAPEGGGGSIGVPSYGAHPYWRLLLHATDGSTVEYGIQEIEFKHTKTGADLATGGTASASTTAEGSPDGAFDDTVGAAWFSSTAADGEWIKYHFTAPVDVRYLTLKGSQSRPNGSPSAFSVQYSDDDSVWTTAWEVTGQTGWAAGQTREFHAPIDLFFTDLADAPPSYIGQAGKALRVNTGETALEFFTPATTLATMGDVDFTFPPTDGQFLRYDNATGKWKPYTLTSEGQKAAFRGEWSGSGENVTLTFDALTIPSVLSPDAAGWTIVGQADATAGTTQALKSRPIGNSGLCYVEQTVNFVGDTPFKVRYKVSSESVDVFRILVDGAIVLTDSGNTGAFEEFSTTLSGSHTIRYQYSKDPSVAVGDDCVYISQITYKKTADTPFIYGDTVTYLGNTFFCLIDNTTETPGVGTDWSMFGGSGSGTFLGLTDTPASYSGQSLKAVRVKADETGLEFYTAATGGSGGSGGVLPERTRLHRTTTQAIPSGTWTAVQWDSEVEDPVGAFVSSANTRITVPAGVQKARVTAYTTWNTSPTSATVGLALRRNGVEIGASGGTNIAATRTGFAESHLNLTSEWFSVTQGDYYEVYVLQNSGSSQSLNGPVSKFGEHSYVQFEWDVGPAAQQYEAHAAHQGWRVIVTESQTDTFATLAELKFYDRSGTLVPTTGGKVYDTNSHGTYPASQAFDGNTATYWSSLQQTSTDLPGGPGYIFASGVDVGSFKITTTGSDFNTTNSPKNFSLQYTDDDGASWKTYAVYTNQTGWGVSEERTFTVPVVGVAANAPGGGNTSADFGSFIAGKPLASEKAIRFVVATPFTVTTGVHQGSAETAATASRTFSFAKNGVEFLTATFAAAGTVATFSANTATSFAAGDILLITAPSTQDATLADISFTLKGIR
ncbi:putative tail protein [Caulobacter phage CcrSwift]|uniref:Putative tail protein n=1 Tax=Caulobacter phage CcrSwift TaxID=2927984 RepID=K4JVK3_9CAUD|nr:tail protein [Caulobacter phage CcrSwift]AFU88415.1 putative tail protein [Caulobacter phage CcrSwift]